MAALREAEEENTFGFHPAVTHWLRRTFESPTPPQREAWPAISQGEHVLVAAPTGSGKTLCAFLSAIDSLIKESQHGPLPEETRILYVSPLKALSRDVERNLQAPLLGIGRALTELGFATPTITTAVRTGDTPAHERARHMKRPAHIYVTTPESLFILLTSEGGRRMLRTVRTVIVDEIHALIRDKRGAHLALSLERLDQLVTWGDASGEPNEAGTAVTPSAPRVQRIGLSATQRPIERVMSFLLGKNVDGAPSRIVDTGHQRPIDLSLCVPGSPLESVLPAEVWSEIYDQLASLVQSHTTTLIFTNTRRLAERLTRFLAERVGEDLVTSHHGSLSRLRRHAAETALKEGRLKALVATASLELGIDVGEVDLVCQIGSPGSIATVLQRVGRSGHFVGGTPKGRLFPLSRDDLVECTALLQAVKKGELDEVKPPVAPLDILAQQVVAAAGAHEWKEDALFELVCRADPYRTLSRDSFDQVVLMLSEGYATARGRRGAYLHHDRVGNRLKGRRGARLSAITNGGAIPDNFDYEVLLAPADLKIGTVHEDFAIESLAGDVFQLGNTSYQILKVEPGIMRVADAHGQPPTIPFWVGEAPSRADELSFAVSRLRADIAALTEEQLPEYCASLSAELGIPEAASRQLIEYLRATLKALGHMPTQQKLVAERFFDETEGMHVVIHSVYGSRFNRAFGLALRKRFCRSFNVELQAAAGEDALVLSLGPMHSFPLETLFEFLRSKTAREVLTQALLDAPLFQTRWRWNASRALAILRFRGGKKVPPRFQRMQSDDLLALCFPDQVACLENIAGDREIPDHPLVTQTLHDSLTEAMDVDLLEEVLKKIERGDIECVARDLTEPSPLAHEILSARPYAFLDDAPLEERRTQAVQMRRFIDPASTDDFGKLSPEAILQVKRDAWLDPRDADELHDALLVHGSLNESELNWPELVSDLIHAGRAHRVQSRGQNLLLATERLHLGTSAYPELAPGAGAFPQEAALPREAAISREAAIVELVRGRLELVGPTSNEAVATALGLLEVETRGALLQLEGEGFVLRGFFQQNELEEFCERRLLARIHRLTLSQLRREIEPVSAATYLRFLTHYQSVSADSRREGPSGALSVLEQLSGLPLSAASWERDVLPARIRSFSASYLDQLCLGGQITWSAQPRSTQQRGGQARPAQVGAPQNQKSRSRKSEGAPKTLDSETGQKTSLVRSSLLRVMPREDRLLWREATEEEGFLTSLSADARRTALTLKSAGALFFSDLTRATGLLKSQQERAVGELVALGFATSDSFAGLRALLTPSHKRRDQAAPREQAAPQKPAERRRGSHRRKGTGNGLESAGRISWLGRPPQATNSDSPASFGEDPHLEGVAWALLARWGVVFRKVVEREPCLPAWGELLRVYHRLEARGEIRGGRFVSGFSGEQFATNDSIALLRSVRRRAPEGELIKLSAADPLNLIGILTPGSRLPRVSSNQFLLQDGEPIATLEAGVVTVLTRHSEDPLGIDAISPERARLILSGSERGSLSPQHSNGLSNPTSEARLVH